MLAVTSSSLSVNVVFALPFTSATFVYSLYPFVPSALSERYTIYLTALSVASQLICILADSDTLHTTFCGAAGITSSGFLPSTSTTLLFGVSVPSLSIAVT